MRRNLFCSLTVMIAVAFVLSVTFAPLSSANGTTQKVIEWDYDFATWTLAIDIPDDDYDSYKSVAVSERVKRNVEGYALLVSTNDATIKSIANDLKDWGTKENYTAYEFVSGVLAMIQQMEYTPDDVATAYDEYPKFPIETVWDDGGDCEDTSILFVTVMTLLGFDAILLYLPPSTGHTGAHMAAAVAGDLPSEVKNYTFEGKRFYFCETTGDGFKIGDIPQGYENDEPQIIKPSGTPYKPGSGSGSGSSESPGFEVTITIITLGMSVAVLWYIRRRV